MIYNREERIFTNIVGPHVSEKSSFLIKKNNTIVLKVRKNANKIEIAESIEKIFSVKVKSVNTIILKGKKKRNKKNIFFKKNWKKAYITLQKGQNLDLFENKESV